MSYIVETRFTYGFENCWVYNDETPMTFETYEDAKAELDCYLHDLKLDYEDGFLDDYSPEDYQITFIANEV